MTNTIFARASSPGKSGVAVFRLSGSHSLEIAHNFTQNAELLPRQATFSKIYHPVSSEFIDDAILIYFRSPNSFTGEDVVEFHLHGSIAVNNIFTEAMLGMSNVRMAEAGEFAKRAFLNGKMDLTSAEGLADLIDAETKFQHKQATRQMNGELENLYSAWREILLKILSLLEAYIDFPDEDIPSSVSSEIELNVSLLVSYLKEHLNDNRRGERLRNGLYLTIFGPPNAGKSSLMNFLAQRDVAIISNIAGTTRDVIETHLDIGGYPIILADTAGIRSSIDLIEKEGILRAKQNTKNADIKILVIDSSNSNSIDPDIMALIDEKTILLLNKADMPQTTKMDLEQIKPFCIIQTSIKSQQGLNELLSQIEKLAANIAMPLETPSITRLRYRSNIVKSLESLESFLTSDDIVLKAEDIRLAARYLSIITGKIDIETIIGEIFSNFCIGK